MIKEEISINEEEISISKEEEDKILISIKVKEIIRNNFPMSISTWNIIKTSNIRINTENIIE